jgi:cell division protein FtsL
MDKLQTKCMEFLKYDDIKKYFVNPTFTLLYNELYLYIMLICVYHIFFILIILTIIYMLLQVLNNIKTLELKINSNYA